MAHIVFPVRDSPLQVQRAPKREQRKVPDLYRAVLCCGQDTLVVRAESETPHVDPLAVRQNRRRREFASGQEYRHDKMLAPGRGMVRHFPQQVGQTKERFWKPLLALLGGD